MIGPTGAVKVMVATKPVDFRKGAEGLAALVRETMGADPFSGTVYVFRARLLRRHRRMPAGKASGGRKVLLACHHGWRGEVDGGAIAGAPGRVGLASRA